MDVKGQVVYFGRSGLFCFILEYLYDLRRKSRKCVEGVEVAYQGDQKTPF